MLKSSYKYFTLSYLIHSNDSQLDDQLLFTVHIEDV